MDWHSRHVLSWEVSTTMDDSFCVSALERALRLYGKPEIFNTDQGAQFTGKAFTDTLKNAGIRISMDGKGRALDNIFIERLWRSVKYEESVSEGIRVRRCAEEITEEVLPLLQCGASTPIL